MSRLLSRSFPNLRGPTRSVIFRTRWSAAGVEDAHRAMYQADRRECRASNRKSTTFSVYQILRRLASPELRAGALAIRQILHDLLRSIPRSMCELGDDSSRLFMEKSVRDASRVLLTCTEEYVRKAEAGLGGVGVGALDRSRTQHQPQLGGQVYSSDTARGGRTPHAWFSGYATIASIFATDSHRSQANTCELAESLNKTVTQAKSLRAGSGPC